MKQSIAHFSHVHELFLHRVTSRPCKICNQTISGPFYNCDERCIFSIHISCAELPRHVQHPFHAQHTLLISPVKYHGQVDLCNACGGNIVGFKCKCTQCSFLLDIKCSVLTPTKKDSKSGEGHHQQEKKQTLDRQPNHRHLLIKCNKDENYSYACTCCELPIDGDGSVYVYVCLECKALLHKSCADLPLSIQHPFHPSHPLILLPRSLYNSKRFWCDACGQERNGFTYRCLECNFDLDIHCASLKPNRNIEGQELSHPHPFIVCEKTENFSHPCHVCGLPLAYSIYFCPECKFLLHKSCADLPQEIKHLLHPQHALFFRYSRRGDNLFFYRSLQCRACLRNPDRYFFECSECEFYLDLKCAKSKPTTMISKVHLHRLVLSKEPYHKLLCDVCLQPFHNPFFLCPMRDFKVHVRCIRLLPTTIKSRHRHPLTLAYSPIKDHPDEDDEAEFYCDVCEETRVLKEPSYYCKECYSKECTYVAHPHCVVIEIIRALEEEWSRKESNGDGGEVEESISLTFEEFRMSFKRVEEKEVDGVVKAYRVDYHRTPSLNLDGVSKRIMEKLISKNTITTMPWQNWDQTSKVIIIDTYMMLEKLAPILKALLEKYGDFSWKSRLSPNPTMIYLMAVCDALYSISASQQTCLFWWYQLLITSTTT